ncbi:MAG TPA: ATP-binding protein [Telluria sp.]|nr:ATP-binding protein [Telluria sp.]
MIESPPEFDRQVALADILGGVPRKAFDAAMEASVGAAWRLADSDGKTLREGPAALGADTVDARLVVDLEPVGTLLLPASKAAWLAGAARWVELLLGASNRYRMAADLHVEAVHADHRELMQRHAELAESEQRYRTLSAQLEQRVREQVAAIEQGQRRVHQAEKMAALGNLAAGMAHEINNPIGFMRSNLSTAKGYVGLIAKALAQGAPDPAAARRLNEILTDFDALLDESMAGADRVAGIVAALKAYTTASSEAARRELADPNEAVRGAARLVGGLPEGVRLELALGALPWCAFDREGVARVVMALLANARTAMKGRSGAIRVATRADGDWVEIAVCDEGCGIEAERIGRVFDPFYTTQDVGGGMGLGLTVAADVVRAHGGHIEVESVAGGGATFRVRLPARPNDGKEGP